MSLHPSFGDRRAILTKRIEKKIKILFLKVVETSWLTAEGEMKDCSPLFLPLLIHWTRNWRLTKNNL
jgi:hypothetical protein